MDTTPGFVPKHTKKDPHVVDTSEQGQGQGLGSPAQEALPNMKPEPTAPVVEAAPKLNKEPKPKPRATTPWKPASLLDLPHKPGFRRRWCSKSLLKKREAEGWVICRDIKAQDFHRPGTILDSEDMTSATELRELIAMELPEAMAKSREKYYRDLDQSQRRSSLKKFQKTAAVSGDSQAGAYGTISVQPGEAIEELQVED